MGEHTARDSSAGAGVIIEEVGESARMRADMSKTPFLSSSKTNLCLVEKNHLEPRLGEVLDISIAANRSKSGRARVKREAGESGAASLAGSMQDLRSLHGLQGCARSVQGACKEGALHDEQDGIVLLEAVPREELVRELHQSLLFLRTKRLPIRMLHKEAGEPIRHLGEPAPLLAAIVSDPLPAEGGARCLLRIAVWAEGEGDPLRHREDARMFNATHSLRPSIAPPPRPSFETNRAVLELASSQFR